MSELADFRNFCKCTEDHQHSQRCDGAVCAAHEEAIDAEIERLRAALKPFADIGGRYPNATGDDKEMYHSNLGRLVISAMPGSQ